jgi:bacterioferritin-associated ferredoxin
VHICICRQINEKQLKDFIEKYPEFLKKSWEVVSSIMADEGYQCGTCEDFGEMCLDELRQNQNQNQETSPHP